MVILSPAQGQLTALVSAALALRAIPIRKRRTMSAKSDRPRTQQASPRSPKGRGRRSGTHRPRPGRGDTGRSSSRETARRRGVASSLDLRGRMGRSGSRVCPCVDGPCVTYHPGRVFCYHCNALIVDTLRPMGRASLPIFSRLTPSFRAAPQLSVKLGMIVSTSWSRHRRVLWLGGGASETLGEQLEYGR